LLHLHYPFHKHRIPVGARISALVQTGLGAHTTSYAMDTG